MGKSAEFHGQGVTIVLAPRDTVAVRIRRGRVALIADRAIARTGAVDGVLGRHGAKVAPTGAVPAA